MNAERPVYPYPQGAAGPVRVSLFQAIRGPLLLITIGVLFALDHLGSAPFTRTWPTILILIGVLKLLERGAQR